ncbi:hypothetical protein CG436_12975 [Pantoea ananatis]|nr:hypothetical protein CG436_12975 [Pantoea ananatis]
MGSFSLPVQADVLRGLRQPLNNPGARQPSLFLRHSLRPDGPAGCLLKTHACKIECFPGRLASPVVNMCDQN